MANINAETGGVVEASVNTTVIIVVEFTGANKRSGCGATAGK